MKMDKKFSLKNQYLGKYFQTWKNTKKDQDGEIDFLTLDILIVFADLGMKRGKNPIWRLSKSPFWCQMIANKNCSLHFGSLNHVIHWA